MCLRWNLHSIANGARGFAHDAAVCLVPEPAACSVPEIYQARARREPTTRGVDEMASLDPVEENHALSRPAKCKHENIQEMRNQKGETIAYFCPRCRKRAGWMRCKNCSGIYPRAIDTGFGDVGRMSPYCSSDCGKLFRKKTEQQEKRRRASKKAAQQRKRQDATRVKTPTPKSKTKEWHRQQAAKSAHLEQAFPADES